MQKHKGISLMDVVVVLIVMLLGFFISLPYIHQRSSQSPRLVCATNLKGMGTAMMTYGLDYDDKYPVIGGEDAPWSKTLGWDYDNINANYSPGGAQEKSPRTITASWYLLVREVDVGPMSFSCRGTSVTEFVNISRYDFSDLWDFGHDPYKHVSYAMQNPFGKFPVTGASSPDAAVMADMSPWFQDGDVVSPASGSDVPQLIDHNDSKTYRLGNSLNHKGEGQNVLFGDGHVEFHRTPNVSVDNDNIYTYWSNEASPTDKDKQVGVNPTARDKDNDSKDAADSFLAI